MPTTYPTEDDEGRYLPVNVGRNAFLAGERWHDNPFDPDGSTVQWECFHDWREGWDKERLAAKAVAPQRNTRAAA